MEFNEKLQLLRKQKGLTQEELAAQLFVSRTAISKWESGRGYPNIDSLKEISRFFSVSIDELLSGNELLSLAEEDNKQKVMHMRRIVSGLLDLFILLFLFLPFFSAKVDGTLISASLISVCGISFWLKIAYFIVTGGIFLSGLFTLALLKCGNKIWNRISIIFSLGISITATLLFITSRQPYPAAFVFVFLLIKLFLAAKSR